MITLEVEIGVSACLQEIISARVMSNVYLCCRNIDSYRWTEPQCPKNNERCLSHEA